jgi:hypothetical protein
VAADNGHEKAADNLAKYKQNMTAEEIAEGERICLEIRVRVVGLMVFVM